MSESAQQLIAYALELSAPERAVVANAILASLSDSPVDDASKDVQEAWAYELRNRIAELDCGKVDAIPSSEAWKMIDGEIDLRKPGYWRERID